MKLAPDIPKSLQLFTADQSREIDRKTIEEFGIDGFTLMEIAAHGAAKTIRSSTGKGQHGLFVCGKGNNSGDALAAARNLVENDNHSVSIYFVFGTGDLSPDAQKNLDLLKKLVKEGQPINFIDENPEELFSSCNYIVDGIFGTGLNSDVESPIKEIIEKMNRANRPIFAMDIPSGLDADTGQIHGTSVHANFTCTFGTQKIGLYLNGGPTISGNVTFTDLPFPSHFRKNYAIGIDDQLTSHLPSIKRSAKHKYDGGVVHIVAGSKGLTGAAIMAAKSAWRHGAGAVILYAPNELLPVYEMALPQIIKIPLPNADSFRTSHAKLVLNKLKEKPGILLIGPGIGTSQETIRFTGTLLQNYSGPALIDADALAAWDQIQKIDPDQRKEWLITPHPGEAKKYLNFTGSQENPYSEAVNFSKNNQISLLLKGIPTLYASLSGETFITTYDTTPFTRAGFGDVLSGTIAAIWGITNSALWAPVYALLDGYQTFKKTQDAGVIFGPENIL